MYCRHSILAVLFVGYLELDWLSCMPCPQKMRLSILDFIRTTQENKEKTIHIIVMNPYDVSVVIIRSRIQSEY